MLLKLETHQVGGSFKFRGALNRLVGLSTDERARGVVAASTGNHGIAVAEAAGILGTGSTPTSSRSPSGTSRSRR